MKIKKILPLILLALPTLASCNRESLDIEFSKYIDLAYVDEEYDFETALVVETGVDYSLKVYYQDYYEMKEYSLEVRDTFKFTPTTTFDLNVYVTASRGNESITKMKTIYVTFHADPIDELVQTGSFSGYADQGISKLLTTDPKYLHSEGSRTAVDVRFQGGMPYQWGCNVLTLNNFRFLDHWTDKTWDNAVLRFYVYNPTEYDFEFQLRLVDNFKKSLDCDWGHSINVPQFAKAGEWSEILFSLKHYGITYPLILNEDNTRNDEFNVKVKWNGAPSDGSFYNYQFFVDGIDVLPYSKEAFPNLDTAFKNSRETLEYGWENLNRDEGWSRANICFDDTIVLSSEEHPSLSSLHLEFNDVKGSTAENGYFVAFDLKSTLGEGNLPSFRHGTLDLDIYFTEDVINKEVRIIPVLANENGDWIDIPRVTYTPVQVKDNWYHLHIDFTENEKFDTHTNEVILGFSFPGIDDTNKDTAHIYLDNIIFDQNGGLPERPVIVKEDISNGLENGFFDSGWNGCDYIITNEECNSTATNPSSSSLKLTFNSSRKFDNFYGLVLQLQEDFPGTQIPLSNAILTFDIKFVGFEDETVRIKGVGGNNWDQGGLTDSISGTKLESGWTHFEIDTSTIPSFSNITYLVRLGIVLNGVDDTNCNNLTAYIDNILINQK